MEVDPRLQISDLADYRFQSSLAQYSPYTMNNGERGLIGTSQRASSRESSRQQASGFGRTGSTHYHSPDSRAAVAPNTKSNTAGYSGTASPPIRSLMNTGRSYPTPRSESEKVYIKDPTVFVPPHVQAPPVSDPPSLREWRNKLFNIEEPLLLTAEQYLTYFPHVDNVYSHRSTQKYKRKPFVSHYWDCRLKGRPTGTPINKSKKADGDGKEQEKKKRKRKVRERDLCDVKIKVTEFFGTEELEALRKLGLEPDTSSNNQEAGTGNLTFILDGNQNEGSNDSTFGILEPARDHPPNHPGYSGKKWYMVQRVNGGDGEDGEERDLDHKHSLEESDRIKKNSVQRWLLSKKKENKKAAKAGKTGVHLEEDETAIASTSVPTSRFHATGCALQTLYNHTAPTNNELTFYGSSFCPFAQRIWIALELIGVPYQYVEVTERHWSQDPNAPPGTPPRLDIPELQTCNPEGKIPCLKHNNFAVWESLVVLEYLEDLATGQSLFQPAMGDPQLKAHSRLWADFINRRILPIFYALLLLPDTDERPSRTEKETPGTPIVNLAGQHAHTNPNASRNGSYNDESYGMPIPRHSYLMTRRQCDSTALSARAMTQPSNRSPQYNLKLQTLITTLHASITTLVNASHRTGPFFLGATLSYVDIIFAPFIIRLSRVLAYYRGFPRPEVGTRWQAWCDAIENDPIIQRTVSEEQTYRDAYGGLDSFQYDSLGRVDYNEARSAGTYFPEMSYARKLVESEGFGLGGDVWGQIAGEKGW
ncbi:hypothetical protein LTR05_000283 [Lithohypha guttulata]|uniref:GST N-terminal domain-containing protein n=1 Tax=Lithohypha guttulata TaxID=1690604 RepID=A0AAN7T496_9EURO|nr:hypothetical protein LTR05_000283 [Lithohypha guttulata]